MQINPTRLTGLATGLDTDTMVKQMMQPYQMKVDKVKQDRQIIQWRQDLYRDIVKDVSNFTRNYFDVLKPESYMLSKNNFSPFSVEGLSGNNLNVTANPNAKVGEYKMTVTQLAEGPKVQGTKFVNKVEANAPGFGIKIDDNNNDFQIKFDATTSASVSIPVNTITKYNKYSNLNEVANEINKLANDVTVSGVKLSEKAKAVVKDNTIQFMSITKIEAGNEFSLTYEGKNYKVSVEAGNYTADELSKAISSKLVGKKATDDITTFPSGKTITAVTSDAETDFQIDALTIGLKDKNSQPLDIKTLEINSLGSNTADNSDVVVGGSISPTTTKNVMTFKNEIIAGFNDTLNVRVGNAIKTVKLTPIAFNTTISGEPPITTYNTEEAPSRSLQQYLNDELSTARGDASGDNAVSSNDLTVEVKDGKINFISTSGAQVSLFGNATKLVGVSDNFEVNMQMNNKMSSILNSSAVEFRIKDTIFKYDFSQDYSESTPNGAKNKTINDIFNEIRSKTGMDISYSETTKKFTISSTETGANSSAYIEDISGGFFKDIFGNDFFDPLDPLNPSDTVDPTINKITLNGKDALFNLKDPTGQSANYAKSKNIFNIDGVNYTLNGLTGGEVTFKLTSNPDDAVKKIKEFVDKYNEIVDKVDKKISEKKQYTYLPLSDEQKKDMSEDEIKRWEEKAKEGLLKGDPDLVNMLSTLRSAFFSPVEGVSLSLKEIGLDTSKDYTQKGKIIIDESKLKEALKTKGDLVSELFSRKSPNQPTYKSTLNEEQRKERYEEQGIFQRVNDILKDYTRNTDGKGTLLKKAGIQGDYTDRNNTLTEYIKQKDKMIQTLERKMYDRETKLYKQFAQLEKAMNQMNSQSAWLAQQLGGGTA